MLEIDMMQTPKTLPVIRLLISERIQMGEMTCKKTDIRKLYFINFLIFNITVT